MQNENVSQIMHVVGNKLSLAKVFYAGHGNNEWTTEDLQKLRNESIKNLEEWIQEKNITDEGILIFLSKLKNSDWSTKESLNAFKSETFDPYVKPLIEEQKEIQKSLLEKRKLN